MGTTNLFVELVVIGVGAMTWLCLLVVAVFGWKWIPVEQVFSTVALVPLVSLIYLLGIISDRIADSIFECLWVKGLQQQRFASTNEYHLSRRQILTGSERLSDLLEYGRSRMRICRGWTLNSILIAITLNLFVWIQLKPDYPRWSLALFGTIAALSFAVGAWYTWYKLSVTEYRKVKEQAAFLVEKGKK